MCSLGARKSESMLLMSEVTRFARTDHRNGDLIFGIRDEDRFSHAYIVGKTGTAKSTLIETMALQDIARGCGLALIDPRGDRVEMIAVQDVAANQFRSKTREKTRKAKTENLRRNR